MTDPVSLALIAGIAPTLAALGGLFVAIRNSQKADKTIEKTDQIHVLVNSNLSEVKTDLALALGRVANLERLITTLTGQMAPPKAE